MFLNVYQHPYAFLPTAPDRICKGKSASGRPICSRWTGSLGYGRRAGTVMASACHSIAASTTDSLIHIWARYESDLYYYTSTSKEQALLRRHAPKKTKHSNLRNATHFQRQLIYCSLRVKNDRMTTDYYNNQGHRI